jgi:polyhydroxybutyrate depolymerase
MNNFYGVGFNNIVDTANGIVIVPQALDAVVMGNSFGTCWNSGLGANVMGMDINLNEDVDDVGFLTFILDSLENNFNIDTDRIYFVGFSAGGFMCNRMGSELSDRVTSIASVSGTIGTYFTPAPTQNIDVLHIHGTADETIGYADGTMIVQGMEIDAGMGAEELVDYWVTYNNCLETPIYYQYPDTEADGVTFERYLYRDGDNGSTVAHIKVNEGIHTWYYTPVNDIDYTNEIWRFFSNKFTVTTNINNEISLNDVKIFPNPAENVVSVRCNQLITKIEVYNLIGAKIFEQTNNAKTIGFDASEMNSGLYVLRVYSSNGFTDRKFMVK